MHRREFLKSTASVAAASALTLEAQTKPSSSGRSVLPINRGWRYSPKASAAFHKPGFDDSHFDRICLPHTNVKLPWHGFNEQTYCFLSTYRRRFRLPATAKGKRVFVDFEGAMTASTVFCNGVKIGSYRGGYTPFSFELTPHLSASGLNVLSVELDSTERSDIPPFGNEIDYLTFGGIYREVSLRIVPQTHIENIHARTSNVLTNPTLDVDLFLDRSPSASFTSTLTMHVDLLAGDHLVASNSAPVRLPGVTQHNPEDADQAMGATYDSHRDAPAATLTINPTAHIDLWSLHKPTLYTVRVTLLENGKPIDSDSRRIGFREATFTPKGFSLNGEIIKLHGLDRHQMFPWVGQAMAARGQRLDARILRQDFNCNIVRTSHYPQSRHFLDACDEMGLLVLEEIPGWQHIGDLPWQDIAVDNVRRMVRRDWNHPSIVLWGVRINESPDNHDFYTRTNAMAHALDTTRQTGGIRTTGNYNSELLEDVFTYNDFDWPMHKPNHPLFLNTECVGHTFPTKTIDAYERQAEHFHRHARYHDVMASDPQYAGGIAWCAFDYTTHANFGSGDRICYHGVMDIFRTPKPAAMFYKSMVPPAEQIVLEPAFYWATNDESIHFSTAVIASNVEHIRMTVTNKDGEHVVAEGGPNRKEYPHLPYPPFALEVKHANGLKGWGDLRIDGSIGGKVVVSKRYSGTGVDKSFTATADETTLKADGADAVRVVLQVNDEFGNLRHFAADAIKFDLSGPAELIGDNPFGLIGGTGAVWIRAKEMPGTVTLKATHPYLGTSTVTLHVESVPAELA